MTAISTTLMSSAALDLPFTDCYGLGVAGLTEYGFAGLLEQAADHAPGKDPLVSAWIPGGTPDRWAAWLGALQSNRTRFRFLFPEAFHAPAREAHRLFTRGHVGTPIHVHVRVQAHPEHLLNPGSLERAGGWLDEPVLNRLPLMVWMLGPVADVRVELVAAAGAWRGVVMLKHRQPACLSVLEMSVPDDFVVGDAPGLADSLECTGSDGFLRVNGTWNDPWSEPRLVLHRGPMQSIRRDLERRFSHVYVRAAEEAPRIARGSKAAYKLANAYLEACHLLQR